MADWASRPFVRPFSGFFANEESGAQTVAPDLLDASATLHEPTIDATATIVVDLLDVSAAPYEPNVAAQIAVPTIDASATVSEPTLSTLNTILVPDISSIRGDFRWAANSVMVVTDPTDPAYASTPLPPEGAVFRNYAPQTDTWPNTNLYAADMLELIVTMVSEYETSGTPFSLDLATTMTEHAITSMKTGLTTYTYPLTMIAERYTYTSGWNKAEGVGAEYHMRTALLAAYALLRMYKHDTSDYNGKDLSEWALELLDTGRRMQQFSDDRADGSDLPTWMAGSMSEWWNEGATNTTPHWSYHPMFLGDVVWKAYTEAIDQLGDTQDRRDTGTYLLSDVRDDYMTWVDDAIDSHNGLMSDTDSGYVDLPYQRFHCPGDGTGAAANIYHPESSTPSATADWTSDSMFWIVEGLARASNTKADTYVSDLEAMRHGSPSRYYDSYTVSGGATTSPAAADDVTQASALNARVNHVLGDTIDLTWIEASQIDEADPVSDGAWTWVGDNSPPVHYVESIATAVCLWALLTDSDPGDVSGTQVFAPTLDLTIFIPLLDASASFHEPEVEAGGIIATPPLTVGTIYEPTVGRTEYVVLELLNIAAAPHQPILSAGSGNVFPDLLDTPATLHEPTLSASADIAVETITAATTVAEPTLTTSNDIVAPPIAAGTVLYEPSFTISVIVPHITSSTQTYEPTLNATAYVTLDIIDAAATLHEPTLTRGAVTLLIPTWNTSTVVHGAEIDSTRQVVVPLLDSSAILSEPTLTTEATITVGLLDLTVEPHEPTAIPPYQQVDAPHIGPSTAVHNLTIPPPAPPFETAGRWGMLPIGLSSP